MNKEILIILAIFGVLFSSYTSSVGIAYMMTFHEEKENNNHKIYRKNLGIGTIWGFNGKKRKLLDTRKYKFIYDSEQKKMQKIIYPYRNYICQALINGKIVEYTECFELNKLKIISHKKIKGAK